jgi:predicted 3-demethylubiquinone-9 3-methyltransferase (glyoxalase superfamily)
MGIVRPHLWFHDSAEQAAQFYASVVPNSEVTRVVTAPAGVPDVEEGTPFVVDFTLDGMPVTALNAGSAFTLDEAFSLYLTCETQEEVDHYWEALAADGGKHGPCGWLTDKFGVSWQVVPRQLDEMMSRPDADGVARATAAMLAMTKIEIEPLEAAYAGR